MQQGFMFHEQLSEPLQAQTRKTTVGYDSVNPCSYMVTDQLVPPKLMARSQWLKFRDELKQKLRRA